MAKEGHKYIFVLGGVMSGVGKGVATSSMGLILQERGYEVNLVKIDPYLNVDAGTMNPTEHGEVFVLSSGLETDQDMGNYERFLGRNLGPEDYMTSGMVYQSVINRERALGYKGKFVEAIPHVRDEIIERLETAASHNGSRISVIEIGGTVGDFQNALFIEAAVESIRGALAADAEGVDRIELCGLLHDGAVTPSIGLITRTLALVKTPVHVFIRPRVGDFVYDRHDVDVMGADIKAAKAAGAPGVVFGALTKDGAIDRAVMSELIALARPMTVGFHRAFDQLADQAAGLDVLIALGVAVVLTSGGPARALDGAEQLRRLVDRAAGRIAILAGGGVTPDNVADLLDRSGVHQVHGKAFSGLRAADRLRS